MYRNFLIIPSFRFICLYDCKLMLRFLLHFFYNGKTMPFYVPLHSWKQKKSLAESMGYWIKASWGFQPKTLNVAYSSKTHGVFSRFSSVLDAEGPPDRGLSSIDFSPFLKWENPLVHLTFSHNAIFVSCVQKCFKLFLQNFSISGSKISQLHDVESPMLQKTRNKQKRFLKNALTDTSFVCDSTEFNKLRTSCVIRI